MSHTVCNRILGFQKALCQKKHIDNPAVINSPASNNISSQKFKKLAYSQAYQSELDCRSQRSLITFNLVP